MQHNPNEDPVGFIETQNYKGPALPNLFGKVKVAEVTHDFNTYHKASVVKAVWYLWGYTWFDQWNKIKNPTIDWHIFDQLILT